MAVERESYTDYDGKIYPHHELKWVKSPSASRACQPGKATGGDDNPLMNKNSAPSRNQS